MKTTKQDTLDMNRNPTGKGGFQDHPELRSDGGWKKEDSIGYQYNYLMRLTINDFKKWLTDNPEDERTMAQELAYQAMLQARKDLAYLKEVTDRTEGKPKQSTDFTSGGKPIELPLIISTIQPQNATPQAETKEDS